MFTGQAYSGDTKIKARYIRQFNAHVKADDLIRGSYVESVNSHWQGCAVSCVLNDRKIPRDAVKTNHNAFETEPIKFPEWLGLLIDHFHEHTSSIEFSQRFQVRLLKAIPVGFTDWQTVQFQFLKFVLESCKHLNPKPVQRTIDLFDRALQGDMPSDSEWSAAELAAWSAAGSAARSAANDSLANHLCELFEARKADIARSGKTD